MRGECGIAKRLGRDDQPEWCGNAPWRSRKTSFLLPRPSRHPLKLTDLLDQSLRQ